MTVVTPTFPSSQDPTAVLTYAAVDTEVATLVTNATKPAADSTATAVTPDVIGDKADTALASPLTAAVSATASIVRYLKTIMARLIAPSAADNTTAAASSSVYETLGRKDDAVITAVGTTKGVFAYVKTALANVGFLADAAVYAPTGAATVMAYAKGHADMQEKVVATTAAVLAAGTATIFTVTGGPIEVLGMVSISTTINDATATLLKYTADPTDGAATDLTIASASLASAAAGTSALVTGTFASAPTISANGVVAGSTTKFVVPVGVIQTITTGGASTGLWKHYLRYRPLAPGVTVA